MTVGPLTGSPDTNHLGAIAMVILLLWSLFHAWLMGLLFRPSSQFVADEQGLVIGRWRPTRYAWTDVAGMVLDNANTLRVAVLRDGALVTYTCWHRFAGPAQQLFDYASERVGREGSAAAKWRPRSNMRSAVVLVAILSAPTVAFLLSTRAANAWVGWILFAGLALLSTWVTERVLSFQMPFFKARRKERRLLEAQAFRQPFADWEAACLRHAPGDYR